MEGQTPATPPPAQVTPQAPQNGTPPVQTPAGSDGPKAKLTKQARKEAATKIIADSNAKMKAEIQAAAPVTPPPPQPAKLEPPKVEPPKVDNKYAKKTVELQERESKLSNREAELTKKENAIVARELSLKNIKTNPAQFLKENGLTFQEFADFMIADAKTPEGVKRALQAQADELQKIREKLDADTKAAEEKKLKDQQDFIDNSIADFRKRLKGALEADKEKYELVNLAGAEDLVYDTMKSYYDEYGTFPDYNAAAQAAETFLEERAKKMMTSKKFKPKEEPKPEPKVPKTLTNSAASGKPSTDNTGVSLSKQERWNRAIAKIKFD